MDFALSSQLNWIFFLRRSYFFFILDGTINESRSKIMLMAIKHWFELRAGTIFKKGLKQSNDFRSLIEYGSLDQAIHSNV